MQIKLQWQERHYRADLSMPIHIAIPLENEPEEQPNAFGAPPYEHWPHREGEFTGSLEAGAPVNFYNLKLNPHGNGTHTECSGHISETDATIHTSLQQTLCVAELVSVFPTAQEGGMRAIERHALQSLVQEHSEALVVRTLPNHESKKRLKYTGTNPPYFSQESMEWIAGQGYKHLLTDLPSVDPEEDEGALIAHKTFWGLQKNHSAGRTITEMIFVDNSVVDGLYLLDIQVAALTIDASPSRPILYKLNAIQ